MALAPANDRRRVKVYELKNNDWYDRGTGFCAGQICSANNAPPEHLDARIIVTSEDDSDRTLLETRISKDDVYQKQQETLIVWTDPNGVDMALSFQEAEGCAGIWEFVSDVQSRLMPEDGISDDLLDTVHSVVLPEPQLGRLEEVEEAIRVAASTPAGRDALSKFIMSPEQLYVLKLAPLVEMAEDLESTQDLHRLCAIVKLLILLNDTSIIEFCVTDQAINGVVGALECLPTLNNPLRRRMSTNKLLDDPDFPLHRAHHRKYLSNTSKFKEVVKIDQLDVKKKIHYTYRLLYLKDVVLARILDDPTFSVLNSLIFFHQVEIVNHLQSSPTFLRELFGIFSDEEKDVSRKREAVLFIQNCCAIAKNIQAASRTQLYQNFINHGLFPVITFGLRHNDAAVRVAGTDILVSLIDHDAHMVRNHIFKAINEKGVPLTDTLIELLLVEVDLGVKTQMADAIKILLDPSSSNAGMEMMNRQANAELMAKQRGLGPGQHQIPPPTEAFISSFYEDGAKRLFQPLKDLEHRQSMIGLTVQETTLYAHLVEILSFFVRQHSYRSKLFILSENLHSRIAQLLTCPQKFVKLIALKWFKTCISLQDEFHNRQLVQNRLFEPILNIVFETMPKDTLLNSACLDLFEHIKRENIGGLVSHLTELYRERLMSISYVNTFQAIVLKYDQNQQAVLNGEGDTSFTTEPNTPDALSRVRLINGRQVYSGLKEPDADEDAYFNADDDGDGDMDEDDDIGLPTAATAKIESPNGQISPVRPLVNYPDDEDDTTDILASSPDPLKDKKSSSSSSGTLEIQTSDSREEEERGRNRTPVPVSDSPGTRNSPPESLSVKRRRDDDDDDELGKLMGSSTKRRNSSASTGSNIAATRSTLHLEHAHANVDARVIGETHDEENHDDHFSEPYSPSPPVERDHGHMLRRKGSLKVRNEGPTNPGRYAIKPIHHLHPHSNNSNAKNSQEAAATAATMPTENGSTDSGG